MEHRCLSRSLRFWWCPPSSSMMPQSPVKKLVLKVSFDILNQSNISIYSARRLIGSRIIESAAYCDQIELAPLFINSTQNTSVNWIIRLLLSLLCQPKVILLSGGHCIKNIHWGFVIRTKKGLRRSENHFKRYKVCEQNILMTYFSQNELNPSCVQGIRDNN